MSKNQTEIAKQKVEHIRTNFPQIIEKKVNPFTSPKVVEEVKKSLYECGLYTGRYEASSANIDAAIINLILKAQGKTKIKRPYVGRSRIAKETLT